VLAGSVDQRISCDGQGEHRGDRIGLSVHYGVRAEVRFTLKPLEAHRLADLLLEALVSGGHMSRKPELSKTPELANLPTRAQSPSQALTDCDTKQDRADHFRTPSSSWRDTLITSSLPLARYRLCCVSYHRAPSCAIETIKTPIAM